VRRVQPNAWLHEPASARRPALLIRPTPTMPRAGLHPRVPDADKPCGYLRGWTYEQDDQSLIQDFSLPLFAQVCI
jgi:hypothetical protein